VLLSCFSTGGIARSADDALPLDTLVLKRSASGGQIVLTGRILDYTGTNLSFQDTQTKATRNYPANQVQSVETPQNEAHMRGAAAFGNDRVEEARTELTKALEAEPRSWVRREILALLLRCELRKGDYYAAAKYFETLIDSDPSTMHFRYIPLLWSNEPAEPRLVESAQLWLQHQSEPMQLIGASVLLSQKQQVEAARVHLRLLMSSLDPRVYTLAEAQLWRTRLSASDLDSSEVGRWMTRLEKIPAELRGGPYFVLGQSRLRLQEFDQAAMMLLWMPMVYADDYHLAARACYEAGDALARIGQTTEASTLLRELPQRFSDSPYAVEAVKRLESEQK
jgi:TolA-binding protein